MQVALEEPLSSEGVARAPTLGKVSSPAMSMEKESAVAVENIVQPTQEEEPVLAGTVPKDTGDTVVGDDQASWPDLFLVAVVKAPAQGGVSSLAFGGREDVSFPELYAGAMAQFYKQQVSLMKMKQDYEVFLLLLVQVSSPHDLA